jgi:hypothetical protein
MQKMAGEFKEEDLTSDMIDLDFWFTFEQQRYT